MREEDWIGQAGSYHQVFLVWKKPGPGLCEQDIAAECGNLHSGALLTGLRLGNM